MNHPTNESLVNLHLPTPEHHEIDSIHIVDSCTGFYSRDLSSLVEYSHCCFFSCFIDPPKHWLGISFRLPGDLYHVGHCCCLDRYQEPGHPFQKDRPTTTTWRFICFAGVGYCNCWWTCRWFCCHGRKFIKTGKENGKALKKPEFLLPGNLIILPKFTFVSDTCL